MIYLPLQAHNIEPMNVTGTGIAVALAVMVVLGFLAFGTPILAPFTAQAPAGDAMMSLGTTTSSPTTSSMQPLDPAQPLPTELTITDTVVGTGAEATPGSTITVNYTGAFPDGSVFDTSAGRGPLTFALGTGRVIRGWDEGFAGMKVGGKRTLIVPPSYGYGPDDYQSIPGGSTLIFEVELLSVQ